MSDVRQCQHCNVEVDDHYEYCQHCAHTELARQGQQLADLRAACEQKQEIINSFDLVDKARREENYKLEQQLADMRLAVEEAYFEGRQDMLAITAGGINSDHSWEESSALAALTEQDNDDK